MTTWTGDELNKIGNAEEVQITSVRRDGSMGKPVTTWIVRHRDDLFVRSVRGRNGHWFRAVQERHKGRIRGGDLQKDVTFEDSDDVTEEVDTAYRTKYRRYAGAILNSVLTSEARAATLKVVPRPRP